MKKQEQDQPMNLEAKAYCKILKKATSLSLSISTYIWFRLCFYSLLEIIFKLFKFSSSDLQKNVTIKYNLKCLEFLMNILIPLNKVVDIIFEYKYFDISVKFFKVLIPSGLKVDSTMEDIYYTLRQIPKSKAQKLFREISPDLSNSEYLIHLFYTSDKENFIKTLLNGNYNLQKIKEFCDVYSVRIENLYNFGKSRKRIKKDVLKFEAERILNEYIKARGHDEYSRISNQLIRGDYSTTKFPIKDLYASTKYILFAYFFLLKECTLYEKKVLDKIIKRFNRYPCYKKVYDKIYLIYQNDILKNWGDMKLVDIYKLGILEMSEIDSETSKEITSIEKLESSVDSSVRVTNIFDVNYNGDFFLDEDYFKQQLVYDDKTYFCKLKENIKSGGGTRFMEFINWLAEEGYIDNESQIKATLAFRLTGICPPKELKEKIEWKKDVNDLAYIIRYFYPQTSKWSKINIFFSCTLQTFNLLSSSYADNVNEQFKNKIQEFYPNIESKE